MTGSMRGGSHATPQKVLDHKERNRELDRTSPVVEEAGDGGSRALSLLTITALRNLADKMELEGTGRMQKAELITALQEGWIDRLSNRLALASGFAIPSTS